MPTDREREGEEEKHSCRATADESRLSSSSDDDDDDEKEERGKSSGFFLLYREEREKKQQGENQRVYLAFVSR